VAACYGDDDWVWRGAGWAVDLAVFDVANSRARHCYEDFIGIFCDLCVGLYLAFSVGMTEFWLLLSYGLLFVAGILGIFVDERWAHKLREASPENFAAVRAQWVPFVSTLLGPVLWLAILWLMISKPG